MAAVASDSVLHLSESDGRISQTQCPAGRAMGKVAQLLLQWSVTEPTLSVIKSYRLLYSLHTLY